MTVLTRLVRSPGVWLAPIALAILFLRLQGVEESGEGFHTAVVLMDVSSVTFIAPLIALAGAWEGSKLRFARVLTLPRMRSTWAVAAGPVAVAVLPAVAVMVVFSAFDGPASGIDWVVLVGGMLTNAAWGIAGFGLGCLLLPVISLPVALVASALWLILARANEPLWLRHLTGAWTGCCFMNETIASAPLLASLLTNAGIAVAGGMLVWAATRRMLRPAVLRGAAVLAVLTVAAFGASSALLVKDFGYSPAQPRAGETECVGSSPEICLWPEHRGIQQEVEETADDVVSEWTALGIDVPASFDEGLVVATPEAVHLVVSEIGDANDWISSFSEAMLSSACESDRTGRAGDDMDVDTAWAWLVVTAGRDPDSAYQQVSPPAAERAAELLNSSDAAVWINAVISDLRSCM